MLYTFNAEEKPEDHIKPQELSDLQAPKNIPPNSSAPAPVRHVFPTCVYIRGERERESSTLH